MLSSSGDLLATIGYFLRYGGYAVLGEGQSDLQLLGHMQ